ncbi:MAG: class I SAM-dependent methyltransferase [Eubacteriales bacterium]
MPSNHDKVREMYIRGKEDTRAIASCASGLEFHYTKKLLSEYIRPDSRVIEIGCATGYYAMHFADKCARYTGVDLMPEHIELFKDKIKSAGLTNVTARVGDATCLDNPDCSFDIVLCLGPMYHLPTEERELAVSECVRIAADGAVIAFAYISPMGAYLKGVLSWPENYPNEKANEYCLRRGIDDLRPELLFYYTPEQMSDMARSHGLSVLRNAGVDFTFNDSLLNNMSEEHFKAWMELSDYMVQHESCTGLANHGLLICAKGIS